MRADVAIRQTADGRWEAQIENGWTEHGTRRRKKFSGKTAQAVRQKIIEWRAEQTSGATNIDPRATVKRYADQWLTQQETRVRPGTLTTDRGNITKWITPTIGNRMLAEVGAQDLRKIDTVMREAGRSSTTINGVYRTAKKMLRTARRDGYKVTDSALLANPPSVAVTDRDALRPADAIRLLVTSARKDGWPALPPDPTPRHEDGRQIAGRLWTRQQRRAVKEWGVLRREREWAQYVDATRWLAALLQGLRQGEALGLQWEQIDFDRNQIIIEWELQRLASGTVIPDGLRAQELGGSMWLLPPKSRAGVRVIPMVPMMADTLLAWREVAPKSPHGLVWPRPDGRPMSDALDRLAWRGLQAAAGVERPEGRPYYIVHEARHTTVTLLQTVGAPPEVIIAIVGHAAYSSTKPYMHADMTARAIGALQGVAELLGAECAKTRPAP